jgi:hypothetical protein
MNLLKIPRAIPMKLTLVSGKTGPETHDSSFFKTGPRRSIEKQMDISQPKAFRLCDTKSRNTLKGAQ